jgi:type IV fimbrial biogenesis protein FimT
MSAPSLVRGFTILELMVGLAIAALLVTLGMPSFTTFLRNSEIRSTAESISNGLRVARTEATRLNTRVSFTLVGGGNPGWAINQLDSTATLIEPPIQQYAKLEAGKSAQAVITPANAVAVTFNELGRVVRPSPIATPNLQQIDVGSLVAGEARTLRIYVDDPPRGMRMCDPDPAIAALVPPDARAC